MAVVGLVAEPSIYLKNGSDPASAPITWLAIGTQVTTLEDLADNQDGWIKVSAVKNGTMLQGYVDTSFIDWDLSEPAPLQPPPAPPAAEANELPVQTTKLTAAEIVASLQSVWADLSQNGIRTLAAQSSHETTAWANCYDWNLGNFKAKDKSAPYMYLRNAWECLSSADAASEIKNAGPARGGGQTATYATDDQILKRGACAGGRVMVMFEPPHPTCRFLAYRALNEGAAAFCAYHKDLAAKQPGFLTALSAGDIPKVVGFLVQSKYFTGSPTGYINGMTRARKAIDSELGAIA